jgi:L,D-transpeptidase YcbB
MRIVRTLLAGLAFAFCVSAADHPAQVRSGELREAIEAALADPPPDYPGARENWGAVRAFYAARAYVPMWVGPRGTRDGARDLLAAICDAEAEGLRPSDYRADQLERALSAIDGEAEDPAALAEAETLLSLALVRYGIHLATGRIPPQQAGWSTARRELNAAEVLWLADEGHVKKALAALEPKHEQYAKLKEALRELRTLEATGSWPEVPRGEAIEPGARDPRVRAVRERLRASGELESESGAEPDLYDPPLVESVRRFQERHALEPDGVIGGATLAALRASPADRIAQIEVNLERWRWVPEDLGERHVLVNVPAFDLQAFEDGERITRMRVIAGLPDWPTPVFTTQIEGVRFSPDWWVPQKILTEEIVPNLQADPKFAQRVGLRVISKAEGTEIDPASVDWTAIDPENDLPYRIIQPSGTDNPLGHVRFVMPNRYAVFLHDTPDDSLFQETQRAFSHGCVRVEKPVELTEFVLRGTDGWSDHAVAGAFESNTRRTAYAADPPQLHLVYFTAWVEDEGLLRFPNDIYGRDPVMTRLLSKGDADEHRARS